MTPRILYNFLYNYYNKCIAVYALAFSGFYRFYIDESRNDTPHNDKRRKIMKKKLDRLYRCEALFFSCEECPDKSDPDYSEGIPCTYYYRNYFF